MSLDEHSKIIKAIEELPDGLLVPVIRAAARELLRRTGKDLNDLLEETEKGKRETRDTRVTQTQPTRTF